MNDTERYTALLATVVAVVMELEKIRDMVSALSNHGPSPSEPVTMLTHSAQVNAFVYSAELKVSPLQY